ncbi:MAG: NUDIX domain-containing protein [Patescibacteria group bacterium]
MNNIAKRAVGIIVKDNKILLIHRFNPSWQKGWYYVFPGGGVEERETTEEATIREIKEELSLDAKIDRLLFVQHNPTQVYEFEGRDEYFYLITDFSGEVELGGPEKEKMNENNQFYPKWVKISEMKNIENLYPIEAKEKLIKLLG